MASAIVRQWHVLSLLPKGPRRIDTATLAERLRDRGLDVHRRTVQRDLVELARVFPIVSDDRTKPYGWRWADHAELACTVPLLGGDGERAAEIDLVLRVQRGVEAVVREGLRGLDGGATRATPRATSRADAQAGDAHVLVEARVPDVMSLRHWLLGFADAVEVLSPAPLRAELAERAARLAAIYDPRR